MTMTNTIIKSIKVSSQATIDIEFHKDRGLFSNMGNNQDHLIDGLSQHIAPLSNGKGLLPSTDELYFRAMNFVLEIANYPKHPYQISGSSSQILFKDFSGLSLHSTLEWGHSKEGGSYEYRIFSFSFTGNSEGYQSLINNLIKTCSSLIEYLSFTFQGAPSSNEGGVYQFYNKFEVEHRNPFYMTARNASAGKVLQSIRENATYTDNKGSIHLPLWCQTCRVDGHGKDQINLNLLDYESSQLFFQEIRDTEKICSFQNSGKKNPENLLPSPDKGSTSNVPVYLYKLYSDKKKEAEQKKEINSIVKCTQQLSIPFNKKYESVYSVNNNIIESHLIELGSSGSGNSGLLGRVDDTNPKDYIWTYDIPNKETMGVIEATLIPGTNTKYSSSPNDIFDFICKKLGLLEENYFNDNNLDYIQSSNYFFQGVNLNGHSYILCNSPYDSMGTTPFLTIRYYRRIRQIGTKENGDWKVVKRQVKLGGGLLKQIKNPPEKESQAYFLKNPDSRIEFGIDLPISFNSNTNNLSSFLSSKSEFPALKNKGNLLSKNTAPRAAGGQNGVMRKIKTFINNNPEKKVFSDFTKDWSGSATQFTNFFFRNWNPTSTPSLSQQMKNINDIKLNNLPMTQEWCHLMGHGDGGDETQENLVSGSKHCNTEQLAIEMAMRHVTHKSGGKKAYTLKTTAYLFDTPNSMLASTGNGAYLKQDQLKDKKNLTKGKAHSSTHGTNKKDDEFMLAATNAPIAQFIRYKIFENTTTGLIKKFDYVFEAQSEFFDINQANIVYANILLALDKDSFLKAELPFKGSKAQIDNYEVEALAPTVAIFASSKGGK